MSKEHAYAYEAGYRDGSIHYELEHCPACKNVADLQEALVENAKLRELVRSAVRCITDAPDCDSCALGEQVSGVWVCHFIGAARELGVEVGV